MVDAAVMNLFTPINIQECGVNAWTNQNTEQ